MYASSRRVLEALSGRERASSFHACLRRSQVSRALADRRRCKRDSDGVRMFCEREERGRGGERRHRKLSPPGVVRLDGIPSPRVRSWRAHASRPSRDRRADASRLLDEGWRRESSAARGRDVASQLPHASLVDAINLVRSALLGRSLANASCLRAMSQLTFRGPFRTCRRGGHRHHDLLTMPIGGAARRRSLYVQSAPGRARTAPLPLVGDGGRVRGRPRRHGDRRPARPAATCGHRQVLLARKLHLDRCISPAEEDERDRMARVCTGVRARNGVAARRNSCGAVARRRGNGRPSSLRTGPAPRYTYRRAARWATARDPHDSNSPGFASDQPGVPLLLLGERNGVARRPHRRPTALARLAPPRLSRR
jgi:hypothetical protein